VATEGTAAMEAVVAINPSVGQAPSEQMPPAMKASLQEQRGSDIKIFAS